MPRQTLNKETRQVIAEAFARILEEFPFKDYEGVEIFPNDDTATVLAGNLLDAILDALPVPHVLVATEKCGKSRTICAVFSDVAVDFTVFDYEEREKALERGVKPGEAPYPGRHSWGRIYPETDVEAMSYNPDAAGYDSMEEWIKEWKKRQEDSKSKKNDTMIKIVEGLRRAVDGEEIFSLRWGEVPPVQAGRIARNNNGEAIGIIESQIAEDEDDPFADDEPLIRSPTEEEIPDWSDDPRPTEDIRRLIGRVE